MKIQIVVMPAWIAGIPVCKDASETSMLTWIPALHAGMTQLKVSAKTARYVIIEEGHEADHQTQS